jgi:hypothetical protein
LLKTALSEHAFDEQARVDQSRSRLAAGSAEENKVTSLED